MQVTPKTPAQKRYLDLIATRPVTVVTGPSGSGKTMLATHAAMEALLRREIRKIVVTRPAVTVQEEHGFLPGNLQRKMHPWVLPVLDYAEGVQSRQQVRSSMGKDIIEIAPLSHMRGRTFENAFVICDEAQNATREQMMMLLTRLGEGSRIVITGDVNQSDIGEDNGLSDLVQRMMRRVETHGHLPPELGLVEFGKDDVLRSAAVRRILELYETPSTLDSLDFTAGE